MICLKEVKRYCQEYWKIKNYQEAVNDQTQTWHCHHIHEIDWALPMKELIAIGRYYDVHYSELIFLTPEEHNRLHNAGENNPMYGKEGVNKGKKFTEETKRKMSNALKGREGPFKGKLHTEESKAKMTKYHITAEELYDLYVLQGLSLQKIAKLHGCATETIRYKLKKHGIIKHGK